MKALTDKNNGKSSYEQLVKFVFTNAYQENGELVIDRESLGRLETDIKRFEDVAVQASNAGAYVATTLKNIDSKTGLATFEMFVQKSEANNVEKALEHKIGNMFGANYTMSNARPVKYATGTMSLHGKKAQTRAKAEIAEVVGGKIYADPTKSNPDRYRYLLPIPDDVDEKDKSWINKSKKAVFSGSLKMSSDEQKKRNEAEELKRIAEEEKKTAKELLEIKREFKEVEKARLQNARLIQKMEEDEAKEKATVEREVAKYFADEEISKKQEEERKLKEQEKREAYEKAFEQNWLDVEAEGEYEKWEKADREASKKQAEEKKKISESVRKTTAIFKAGVAVVTVIADLIRRILTATLQNASKMDKQNVENHNLGLTYMDRRNFDLFDKAHGLPEGASINAVKSVQSMFGDVTNLDEGALGILARVMGSEVGEMVKSGMGGENPDKLLEKILDKYFAQFKTGKNSLGQNVGQAQARRELVTSLQSVSPEIASLFARMTDDYMSGVYGKFNNTEEWRKTTDTNRTGLTSADTTFAIEIGKKYNEILAIVEDLKTSFFTRLASSMNDLLDDIKNIRVGTTATKSIQMDRSNYQKNEDTKKVIKAEKQAYNASTKDRLAEINRIIPSKKPSTDYRFNYTAEILAGIASGDIDEKYLRENYVEGTGMLSQNPSEVKAYIERGKTVLKTAMLDSEVNDEIVRIQVANKTLKEIEAEQKKGVGGKVKEVSYSLAQETAEAQKLFKDVSFNVNQAYGDVNSPVAQDILKQAYSAYLQDNPTEYWAMYYDLFGEKDENGKKILINGQSIKLANSKEHAYNYADVKAPKGGKAKEKVQEELRKELKRRVDEATKEKGSALTNDEWKDIVTGVITDYDGLYWEALHHNVLSMDRGGKNVGNLYILSATEDAYVENLSSADSAIIGALARELVTYSNGNYNYSGQQGTSGEYVLTIVGTDAKGNETSRQTLTLNDTRSAELSGSLEVIDGNIVFKQAK